EIDGAEDITVEGIAFEATTGLGLKISSSNNVHINNCYFRNIGNTAIDILDSKNVQVSNCTIHDTGDGGINVAAGDRKTLTPANISIYNNHIYNVAKWVRCYQPPIKISDVGISATHNLIHDCPHTAILFTGNDITIEYNEIYSVVMETGDAGAIYTGRDYTFRGNRVCYNYVHHLGGIGMGTMGIYNDDCVSGTYMEGNVFHEVSRAIFLGGGRDFVVKNNVFIDCYPSIRIDGRGASNHNVWRNMVFNIMKNRFYEIGGDRSPYIEKYPELAVIDEFYKQGRPIPPKAVVRNNAYCSERKLELAWDSEKGEILSKSNYACGKDDFEDFKTRDFRLKADSEAFNYGFENVDFHRIGLVEKDRMVNPPKVTSHMEVDVNTNALLLLLNNRSDNEVRGKIIFHINKHVEGFSGTSVDIDLAAHEVKEYRVALPPVHEKVQIEARCDVAGVRPCRTEYAQGDIPR
ncbi:MAG: right-handed parallel beta-helix repeat-containing protein, partial [Clostridiaceae bacterium]|nr:right-handed parallel beta-helix repeat-containing protein [Clostridiaceae bacterium]